MSSFQMLHSNGKNRVFSDCFISVLIGWGVRQSCLFLLFKKTRCSSGWGSSSLYAMSCCSFRLALLCNTHTVGSHTISCLANCCSCSPAKSYFLHSPGLHSGSYRSCWMLGGRNRSCLCFMRWRSGSPLRFLAFLSFLAGWSNFPPLPSSIPLPSLLVGAFGSGAGILIGFGRPGCSSFFGVLAYLVLGVVFFKIHLRCVWRGLGVIFVIP